MGEANEEKTSVRNDLHTMDLNLYLDAREFDVHVQKNESHKVLRESWKKKHSRPIVPLWKNITENASIPQCVNLVLNINPLYTTTITIIIIIIIHSVRYLVRYDPIPACR